MMLLAGMTFLRRSLQGRSTSKAPASWEPILSEAPLPQQIITLPVTNPATNQVQLFASLALVLFHCQSCRAVDVGRLCAGIDTPNSTLQIWRVGCSSYGGNLPFGDALLLAYSYCHRVPVCYRGSLRSSNWV